MTLRLSIVVPCYNEQEVLPETNRRLLALLDGMRAQELTSVDSAIYYVDDGSRDRTWALIEELAAADAAQSRDQAVAQPRPPGRAARRTAERVEGDALDQHRRRPAGRRPGRSRRWSDEHLAGADVVYGVRDVAFHRHRVQAQHRALVLRADEAHGRRPRPQPRRLPADGPPRRRGAARVSARSTCSCAASCR
ncbi:MAG: glycosyltransferase family 2 protein [Comamonadaceae bacterium]|nr:glycosyltransferase family 2 protein [Comamonadaceae bacterium]